MDVSQFLDEINKIWEQIKELEKQAPECCSAILGISRICIEELANGYYYDPPKKK